METSGNVRGVRVDWFVSVVDRCQEFAIGARVTSRAHFIADADTLLDAIDTPINSVERELLSGLLFQVAVCGAPRLDALYHRAAPCRCLLDASAVVSSWAPRLARGSKPEFRAWASAFADALEHQHVVAPEYRARAIIDRTFASDLALGPLARDVGSTPAALRAAFKQAFGLTPFDYRTRSRIAAAVRLLSQGVPIKSVAVDVGFLSRSKFYATFKRLTGTLPTSVGRLEDAAIERLCAGLQSDAALHRRDPRPPAHAGRLRVSRSLARARARSRRDTALPTAAA